jgi:4-hydroxy-tetrahydrodipicolinate synthase
MTDHIVPYRDQHGIPNQGLDKLLAAIGNWAELGSRLRWPYSSLSQYEALLLRPVARHLLPELFEGESQ